MPALTRRQILISAAATAAVAALPAASAIAAVETAPARMAGWAFVVNDRTKPLLANMLFDAARPAAEDVHSALSDETMRVSALPGPHRWVAMNVVDGEMQIVGHVTWSRRRALIDAGYRLETLT
jgi:hypothetical protein